MIVCLGAVLIFSFFWDELVFLVYEIFGEGRIFKVCLEGSFLGR